MTSSAKQSRRTPSLPCPACGGGLGWGDCLVARAPRNDGEGRDPMFSVIFEVHPKPEQWDGYLGLGRMLKPEVESIEGFIDNIRYRSLRREGWLLSLSIWRDEKALVRWRTQARHHLVQERGRSEIFLDYHLRIGELTADSRAPAGHALQQQRLDETQAGYATTVTLIDAKRSPQWLAQSAEDAARSLGLR